MSNKKKNSGRSNNLKTDKVVKNVLVAVIILAVLVAIGFFYRSFSTGKAVEINVPSDYFTGEVIDLDLEEEVILNLDSDVEEFLIKLKTSKEGIKEFTVKVNMVDEEKDIVQYFVLDDQDDYVSSALLASGDVSGQIYLPTLDNKLDDKADLQISYLNGKLYFKNLNYAVPQASKFVFYDNDKNELKENIFNVDEGEVVSLVIKVTSNVAPKATAAWEDGTILTGEEFAQSATGENFSTYGFTWTAVLNGQPKVLVLTSTINEGTLSEKVTVMKYVFAPAGVVYVLSEENYPEVIIKKSGNKFEVTYTLNSQSNALSLPCGSLETHYFPANFAKVYSYDVNVKSWTKNVPVGVNDLTNLDKTHAYLVKLDGVKETKFTVTCDFNGVDAPETKLLPTLKVGWNFVGAGIYGSVPITDLKTPAGKTISHIYLLKNNGVDLNMAVTELEPGKAYWVKVQ